MVTMISLTKGILYVPIMVLILNSLIFKNKKYALLKINIFSYLTLLILKLTDYFFAKLDHLFYIELIGLTLGFAICYVFIIFSKQKNKL